MARKYKLIVGHDAERLQTLVNTFLASDETANFDVYFIGAPQVFGHEAYAQAIELRSYVMVEEPRYHQTDDTNNEDEDTL